MAHRSLHHAALLRCLHRPRQYRLRLVDDEQGHRPVADRLRLRRRHLLLGLFPVRGALQHHPAQGRRADLDRAGDDHLGHRVGRDGLRAGADQLLLAALPARRCRGRVLSRHHPLSLLLVPGTPACRGDCAVHGGGAALDRAGIASLGRAPGDGRDARLQGLAMAVRAGGAAGGAARFRRAGIPHRPPGESKVARG